MYKKPKAAGMISRCIKARLDVALGRLGINRCHPNSFIPVKPSKKHQPPQKEKAYNKQPPGKPCGIVKISP
jgi:hypothetical protein